MLLRYFYQSTDMNSRSIAQLVACLFLAIPLLTRAAETAAQEAASPRDVEYRALLEEDEKALDEVDAWILEARSAAFEDTSGVRVALLKEKVTQRLEKLEKLYQSFLDKYPNDVDGHIIFGSFLDDLGREGDAKAAWEKALELDKTDPAIWNNLANYYGHNGPVKKAFEFYEKAIDLKPDEALYYHNYATTVYLFRKDATQYWGVDEQKVFDKAFGLYGEAMKLAPKDFTLASDVAQSFYMPKPFRHEEAIDAWKHTLTLAQDENQRQGVYLHLARCDSLGGNYSRGREWLAKISIADFDDLKRRVGDTIDRKERESLGEEVAEE